MRDAVRRVARIGGTRVTIVRVHSAEREAFAGQIAELAPVARVTVRARRPIRKWRVHRARRGIARVRRARIAVVDGYGSAEFARAVRIAEFQAVARVAVGARRPGGDRHVGDSDHGVARIRGAGVSIIDDRRRPGRTSAGCAARLGAIAGIAVGARGSEGDWRVRDAGRRIAAVDRAWIAVVNDGWRPSGTSARCVARLGAVTGVSVGARGPGGHRGVGDSDGHVASVHGAGICVIYRGRRTGAALTRRTARFCSVAGVAIRARRARSDRRVRAGPRRTRVYCARVRIVARRGAAGRGRETVLECRHRPRAHVDIASEERARQDVARTDYQRAVRHQHQRLDLVPVAERCRLRCRRKGAACSVDARYLDLDTARTECWRRRAEERAAAHAPPTCHVDLHGAQSLDASPRANRDACDLVEPWSESKSTASVHRDVCVASW